MTLNTNHKRRLLVTLGHIDELLDEAEHMLASVRSGRAFPRFVADVTPLQARVLADYFARLRETMLARLPELGLEPNPPAISTLRALKVQLIAAGVALEDSRAAAMRGYGAISTEDAAAIERVLSELHGQLERIETFLAESPDQSLRSRLERLTATSDEARLLSELERVIATHGLVELRPALAILVDRIAEKRFEVAVFGRVSSGKSSLLNSFLRRAILPVGVTPITSVPTRVTFGARDRVVVELAEGKTQVLRVEDLASVATEQQNPNNYKHVMRILVEVGEPRLESGIVLVDTPGLGSLAAAAAEQTLAYLPRCDLGIVLVEAGSGLGPQDLAVIRSLYHAGATAQILVSKSDLLTVEQRQQVKEYIERTLATECDVDIPVHCVSVVGTSASLAEEWYNETLLPLCRHHESLAAAALRRKIGALRESVVASLRRRLENAEVNASALDRTSASTVDRILAQTASLPAAARASCEETALKLSGAVESILGQAADRVVEERPHKVGAASAMQEAIRRAFEHHVGTVGAEIAGTLETLRAALLDKLRTACSAVGIDREIELPRVAGLPPADSSVIDGSILHNEPPPWLLGGRAVRRWLLARARKDFSASIEEALELHRRLLVTWSRRVIAELSDTVEAEAGLLRAVTPLATPRGGEGPSDRPAMERDLALLANWPKNTST